MIEACYQAVRRGGVQCGETFEENLLISKQTEIISGSYVTHGSYLFVLTVMCRCSTVIRPVDYLKLRVDRVVETG